MICAKILFFKGWCEKIVKNGDAQGDINKQLNKKLQKESRVRSSSPTEVHKFPSVISTGKQLKN